MSWQAQHFVNLLVQNSWQAQHFVNLLAPLEALAVALSAVVAGCRRWSPVRPSIVIRVSLVSWRADVVAGTALCEPPCPHFVTGAAAALCEPPCADFVAGAQHFVNLHAPLGALAVALSPVLVGPSLHCD